MTTWSSPGVPKPYSSRPCPAKRRTSRCMSLSMVRPPAANAPSGRPVRSACARFATAAPNFPRPTETPSKQASMAPLGLAASVTWPARRARTVGVARRSRFLPGAPTCPSGMRVDRIERAFRQRPIAQAELDRNVVKPARREAAIEMPQPRYDHADDRDLDVGARLVEDEEIEALALGETHAGGHLLARLETVESRVGGRWDQSLAARHQEWMVRQPQRRLSVETRFLALCAADHADGQELVELGQRPQRGDPAVEMRAGPELDVFLAVVDPVGDRHESRNLKIAGDVEHPQPASGLGELAAQIADVGIVEPAEVHLGALRPVVPPDRIGIPLHQLEETLDHGLLARVAGCAAVGIRVDPAGLDAAVVEIQQAGRQVLEALVARGPDRRPFDLCRAVERGGDGLRVVGLARRRLALCVLGVAEQQHVVGQDGLAGGKILEAPRGPDLVALIDAGIALDRLHQGARLALLGGAALAKTAAAQSRAQLVDGFGRPGEIMRGVPVGVEREIGVHAFEPRHHADEGAHMLAVARDGGARRDAAV